MQLIATAIPEITVNYDWVAHPPSLRLFDLDERTQLVNSYHEKYHQLRW